MLRILGLAFAQDTLLKLPSVSTCLLSGLATTTAMAAATVDMTNFPPNYESLPHPSRLFVSLPSGDRGRFTFHLVFFPRRSLGWWVFRGRTFICTRDSEEALASFYSRLSMNLTTYFCKHSDSNRRPLRVEEVHLFHRDTFPNPVAVNENISLEAAFTPEATARGLVLCLSFAFAYPGSKQKEAKRCVMFDVQLNPAHVTSCSIELLPMVGCPLMPILKSANLSIEKSKFQWFVSTRAPDPNSAHWPSTPCAEGFVFVPSLEHVGSWLRLRVLPHDENGCPGIPFGEFEPTTSGFELPFFGRFLVCQNRITHAPMQSLMHDRWRQTSQPVSEASTFRLVSYNLLAFLYSQTEVAKNCLFRQCPLCYLSYTYRFPLIFRELLAYNADIICLQEVDMRNYHAYLGPMLRAEGFRGEYLQKTMPTADGQGLETDTSVASSVNNKKSEGVAIFYRSNRFRLLRTYTVDSLLAEAEMFHDLSAKLKLISVGDSHKIDNSHLIKARSQAMIACLFEFCHPSLVEPSKFIVACTHLYFHPDADALRCIQATCIRRYLSDISQQSTDEPNQIGETNGTLARLPVILAADLNALSHHEAYQQLVCPNSAESPPAGCHWPAAFEPAFTLAPGSITTWVPTFHASIDAILMMNHRQRLRPSRQIDVPPLAAIREACSEAIALNTNITPPLISDSDQHSLPNSQFPSDHLALVVEFKLLTPLEDME